MAVGYNRRLELILAAIRRTNIDKPIFVVRPCVLWKQLPIIKKWTLLKDRVIYLDLVGVEHDKPCLVHIETHICDHCNLNCKACNNYSPFVLKRSLASLEQWEEDIKRLSKIY